MKKWPICYVSTIWVAPQKLTAFVPEISLRCGTWDEGFFCCKFLLVGSVKPMKLENYEVHLPSYSIGNAIYDKIGPVCESYGRTVLVIGGK